MSGKIGKLGVWAGLGLAAICAAQEVGDMDEHQKYSSYQYRFFQSFDSASIK